MKVMNKVIVVTGGGSGIGRALVHLLVNRGARVAAVDINEKTLKETVELAGPNKDKISTHIVNVADRQAVEALPQQVIDAHGTVDAIINNAGIIQPFVRLNDLPYDAIERVLKVNLYSVIYMIKSFLPHLLARPESHIVDLSSMGGFFPVPGQTLYGASKAAVKLLTEGLYAELTETNTRVTVVFPGAVATNISQNSGVSIGTRSESSSAKSFPTTPPERAAEIIVDGMERDQFHVYVGRDSKMMNYLYRLSPRRATRFMYNQMKGLLPS
ncbi:MAG: SDR family oxidoreductase [Anaerolineae bacterium]|nr:SDR family oxidoreductase [Chloroflexota bacterium]MBP6297990.1 SDR family oxidoreductase [Anaerolineae bacterium]